jgi:enoyl-CoA hydratase
MLSLQAVDRIAVVTFDRPPVNSINDEWIGRLNEILDDLKGRPDCSVIHFRSALGTFSAGFDLKVAAERFLRAEGASEMGRSTRALQALYERIEKLSQVTVAEINGNALGGGLEFALTCDIRIAAADSKMGLPEIRLGLLPAAGGTQRLSRICGSATAARLILGSEILDGKTAQDLGVVHWVVPQSDLVEFAASTARRFAGQPRHALDWAKRCIAASDDPKLDGWALERIGAEELAGSIETRKLVDAFFLRGKLAKASK